MLKIHLQTGTAFCHTIITEGNSHSDILDCINEYHVDNDIKKDVTTYDYQELMEYYDNDDEVISELFLPVNGGEFYIHTISHIEEVAI